MECDQGKQSLKQRQTNLKENSNLPRALSSAQCHVLLSAVLNPKYKNISLPERFCTCDSRVLETIEHVLLQCSLDRNIQTRFILTLISRYPGHQNLAYAQMLLIDKTPLIAVHEVLHSSTEDSSNSDGLLSCSASPLMIIHLKF